MENPKSGRKGLTLAEAFEEGLTTPITDENRAWAAEQMARLESRMEDRKSGRKGRTLAQSMERALTAPSTDEDRAWAAEQMARLESGKDEQETRITVRASRRPSTDGHSDQDDVRRTIADESGG